MTDAILTGFCLMGMWLLTFVEAMIVIFLVLCLVAWIMTVYEDFRNKRR